MNLNRFSVLVLLVLLSFQAAAQLTVSSFTPTRFAGNVPVNSNISVTFNLAIDGATLTNSNFVVRGDKTGVIAGTLSGAGTNTVTFDPTSNFKLGENVSFTLTTALRSTTAVAPARGYTFSFDVIAGATVVPPHEFAFRLISHGAGLDADIKAMDINNDGHMDFVVGNSGSGRDESSAFTSDGNKDWCRVDFGANRNAQMFDLDGDGDKDGLSVRPNVFGFAWNRNDAGVFTNIDLSANFIAYNGFCYGVDMDNDGDIDLVGYNSSGLNPPTGVVMHRNNGNGTFASATGLVNPVFNPFLGSDSHMRIADMNGDGAMDVIIADMNTGTIGWWENNGLSTSFTQRPPIGTVTANQRRLISIANIDDDGDLDVLIGDRNNPAGASLFINDGTQTFTQQVLPIQPSTSVNHVRVGDLDGDQDKDIYTASQWLENDGSEVFTSHKLGLTYGEAADFADMDDDGDMDMLLHSHSLQRGIYWLENTLRMNVTAVSPANAGRSVAANSNVTVTFDQPINPSTVTSNTLTVTSRLRGIVSGNYDVSGGTVTFTPTSPFKPGDDIQIAVTERIISTGNHKLVNTYGFDFTIAVVATGVPTFGTNPVVMTYATAPVAMDLGDMDNDGDIDIVSCNATQLHWHRNNGAGVFTPIQITTTGTLSGMSILDINRDGLLDIITFVTGFGHAFINDVSQNFTQTAIGNIAAPLNRIGDLDRNGREDMVSGGAGHFSCNGFTSHATGGANTFSAGDLDGDGDIDIIRSGSSFDIRRNDGAMFFSIVSPSVGTGLGSARADVDNDGDYDAVVATSTQAAWYANNLNTASANFGTGGNLLNIRDARSIVAVDIDGDGDMDLAGAGQQAGSAVMRNRINEGLGFTLVQTIIPGTGIPWVIRSGDMNGDSKMDLVVMSIAPGNDVKWFNNTGGAAPPPTITNFTPTSGAVNNVVVITGTNFSPTPANNTVRFNGTVASVSSATATSIVTGVPVGATTGKITVTVASQTATSATDFIVEPPGPQLTSIVPVIGPVGTPITLTGLNFSTTPANNIVTFDGIVATVTSSTSTTIEAIVPVGAVTCYPQVEVAGKSTNQDGVEFEVTTGPLPEIDDFSPQEGAVGDQVILTGINFGATPADNVVNFNGTVATVIAASTTSLTVIVPIGATQGYIGVQTAHGYTDTSDAEFRITGAPTPTILDFTPKQGSVGTIVTITGTNFSATPSSNIVDFNGQPAEVISSTNTQIKAVVPAGAVTGPISVTVSEITATTPDDFTVTAPVIFIGTHPAASTTVCSGETATLIVEASGDTGITYQWKFSTTSTGTYNNVSNAGGYSGATTASLSVNTTGNFGAGFYRCEVKGANSNAVLSDSGALTVNVTTAPNATGGIGCNPGAITLTASGGSNGQYRWYTQATGGTAIAGAVNATYVTQSLTATTTYYVSIHNGTCESTRTSVVATINVCNPPVITAHVANTQVGGTVTIDLIPLISTNNLDLSSLRVVKQPVSGATATIDNQGMLTIDYTGLTFSGTEKIEIGACDVNGRCSEQAFDITVASEIVVYNAVSPDGKNPVLRFQFIDVMSETKDNMVVIYNRWGDVVFEVSNYNNTSNAFAGISNGSVKLPSGTYYYKVTFASGLTSLTGFLELRY